MFVRIDNQASAGANALGCGTQHSTGGSVAMDVVFWAWVTVAVVLAVGEILSTGLYLLPFAAGAASAAALSALGVSAGWQWIALLGVSSVLTIVIRRLAARHRP